MAGDGPPQCRLPGPRRRVLPADPSPARRSVPWRARYWPCRWRWRVVRSGGCGGPLRQDVEQEAPDELVSRQHQGAVPRLPVAAVILVTEGHAALVEAEQAAVRDSDAVRVAGEISEHRLGPGEGRLGVDEPVHSPEWREVRGKGLPAT